MDVPISDAVPADMTLEALRAEFVALAQPFALITNRRTALAAEIDRREKSAEVQHRVEAMSEDEKAALRAALGA